MPSAWQRDSVAALPSGSVNSCRSRSLYGWRADNHHHPQQSNRNIDQEEPLSPHSFIAMTVFSSTSYRAVPRRAVLSSREFDNVTRHFPFYNLNQIILNKQWRDQYTRILLRFCVTFGSRLILSLGIPCKLCF